MVSGRTYGWLSALVLMSCSPEDGGVTSPGDAAVPPGQDAGTNQDGGTAVDYAMRFGVNGGAYPEISEGQDAIDQITAQLDDLGYVWLRHPGKGTAWFEVQPDKQTWDWRKLDAVIENNRHPWLIELFGQIGTVYPFGGFDEDYMKSLGNTDDIMNYIKQHGVDLTDPQQRADAETYVKAFVQRYRDSIQYWEIGNEGLQSANRLELIQYSYTWTKEIHPEAVVVLTGVVGDSDESIDNELVVLDDLLANGAGDYFDVGNIHYYGEIAGDFEARLQDAYDRYVALLAKHGLDKPVWVTETSTSSHTDSVLSGPSSEAIQARHVVVRLVLFAAKGAGKVLWHEYQQTHQDNKFYQCNLVDPGTGDKKPAYHTLKLLVAKLGHYESVETLTGGQDIRLFRFTLPDAGAVLVAWASQQSTVDLSSYTQGDNLVLTHIIEQRDQPEPETQTVPATAVVLSESPVFLE